LRAGCRRHGPRRHRRIAAGAAPTRYKWAPIAGILTAPPAGHPSVIQPPGDIMARTSYDLILKNVRVVRPNAAMVETADIAIKGGKFAKIAPAIPVEGAKEVYDGRNRLAFPGLVDPHMHTGIYSPLD